MTFDLPDLPYSYDALEPHISEQIMRIHHTKHHQGYTDKLNTALEGHEDLQEKSARALLKNLYKVPEDIRTAVRRNGGGYVNHSLFWRIMSPDGGGKPSGALADEIMNTFGGFNAFKDTFSTAAGNRFGSGWAWLVVDSNGDLSVYNTPNQDSPYMNGHTPILGLDVWEHAYWAQVLGDRGQYIENWWNLVNWSQVEENYAAATR